MALTNWAGTHAYRAATLHRPTTHAQLREVVARAPRVRVLGSRHSFNAIADSAELVSLDGLPAAVVVD
jgi:alditol oxidase